MCGAEGSRRVLRCVAQLIAGLAPNAERAADESACENRTGFLVGETPRPAWGEQAGRVKCCGFSAVLDAHSYISQSKGELRSIAYGWGAEGMERSYSGHANVGIVKVLGISGAPKAAS